MPVCGVVSRGICSGMAQKILHQIVDLKKKDISVILKVEVSVLVPGPAVSPPKKKPQTETFLTQT